MPIHTSRHDAAKSTELVHFTAALGSSSSIAELERSFVAGFGRLMGVRMYGFNLLDPETGRPAHVVTANVSEIFVARYEQEAMHLDPVLDQALRTGRAAYSAAMMSAQEWLESPVYRAAYHLHAIRHVVEVPLHGSDRIVGSLRFADSDVEREFSPDQIRLSEAMGRVLAQAIERIGARERLERERDHGQAALGLTDSAVVISDPDATELGLNETAARLLGDVLEAEEHLHGLIARPASDGGFARRVEVELASGETGVLHSRSSPVHPEGRGLVTVLELELEQPRISTGLLSALTPREGEVAALVVDGLGDREIATQLMLSHHTVSQYVKRVYSKLGVGSRVELTRLLLGARGTAGPN